MFFIGDIHGNISVYLRIINTLPENSTSIQLGDMGLGFVRSKMELQELKNHKFIRGNHDNPDVCRRHPNYMGHYGYIENCELFYFGGGYSIDKRFRTPFMNWWPDEELSLYHCRKAKKIYEEKKPKIVISHECPTEVKNYVLTNYFKMNFSSRTELLLQSLFEIHQPDIWVFAHHHRYREVEIDNTKFVCLSDDREFDNSKFSLDNLAPCVYEIKGIEIG